MIDRDYGNMTLEDLKKEDKFERSKYIPALKEMIISNSENCFVLQISGQYGSGKTFFVNLLNKELAQKHDTLYYNAWKHDYAQDAFISFCSIFINHFETSPSKTGFKEATKKLFMNNIPNMLTYCFKEIFNKYTGIDVNTAMNTVCKYAQDIDDNSQQTEKNCNDLLEVEYNRDSIIQTFRQELMKLLDTSEKNKPLIVFIDDLDRCKPDFAVRLLDYIKHLFNIPGITFVLTVDDLQLKSSIQQFYGAENAAGYLKRIVDFEFKLPLGNYKNYIRSLLKEYQFPDYSINDYFINMLNNLGFMFDLSLRDFKYIFNNIHKIMKSKEDYVKQPYIYYTVFIMENYFSKYKNELSLIETEESKKLSNSQKLVRLFNQKFIQSPFYTNSLFYDSPLNDNALTDHNIQEIMTHIINIPDTTASIKCYKMFPTRIIYSKLDDPFEQKTIYERILERIEKAQKKE